MKRQITAPKRTVFTRLVVFWLLVATGQAVFAADVAPMELVSRRAPNLPQRVGGNGDSVDPVITPDGRFVLFSSSANNLVPNDDSGFGLDVFLRDRLLGTTTLVSVNTNGMGGGNEQSIAGTVSTNGRMVLFSSAADGLVAKDTNGYPDIFLRDLDAGTTRLVSVGTNGRSASGEANNAAMSSDGRVVAFVSAASGLVVGDTNRGRDVFIRTMDTGVTTIAGRIDARFPTNTVVVGGDDPVISADGGRVFFTSTATNLVALPSQAQGEVYVRDLVADELHEVSFGAAALAFPQVSVAAVASQCMAVSGAGRFVVFVTLAVDAPNCAVFFRDLEAPAPVLITTNGLSANRLDSDRFLPVISADGRFVAYVEGSGESGSGSAIRRWEAASGESVPVADSLSTDSDLSGHWALAPSISPDGRFIGFTGLVPGSGFHSVFRRDMAEGTVASYGAGPVGSYPPVSSPSDDGRSVAFSAPGSDGFEEVFVWDPVLGTNQLVSMRESSWIETAPSGPSFVGGMSLSSDGRWVAYASYAADIATNDAKGFLDVFAYDRMRGVSLLVSAGADGGPAAGGHSFNPLLSGNGRFVFFLSQATNLVEGDSSPNTHLFRRDLLIGRTELVSTTTNGVVPFVYDSASPVVSHDGRYVAYSAGNGSLVLSCWRDMQTNRSVCLSRFSSSGGSPCMSTNGLRVAYRDFSNIKVWSTDEGRNILTNAGQSSYAQMLSPDGSLLAFSDSGPKLVLRTLGTPSVTASLNLFGLNLVLEPGKLSADGHWFVVETTALFPASPRMVLLYDTRTGTNVLISHRMGSTAAASAPSDSPSISLDGRYIVFRSEATNLAPVEGTGQRVYVHDRETGSNQVVAIPGRASRWSTGLGDALISASGETVAFQTAASTEPDDRNRVPNVLAWVMTPLDSDKDGMRDAWEREHFGNLDQDAASDWDKDGASDLAEYLAGTHPKDAASRLRIEAWMKDGAEIGLQWPSTTEADSRVEVSDSLDQPVWRVLPGAMEEANGLFRMNPSKEQLPTNAFFRIRVSP